MERYWVVTLDSSAGVQVPQQRYVAAGPYTNRDTAQAVRNEILDEHRRKNGHPSIGFIVMTYAQLLAYGIKP